MTLSDYSKLKQQVVQHVVDSRGSHNNLIQSLKELFRKEINSVRRFEDINSIGQLLQILELRDLLSENNITALKKMAMETKCSSLTVKINEYENKHKVREYLNYIGSEKTNKSASFGGHINSTLSESDKRRDRIMQIVTEQIGTSWRDLARNLKIQEYKIDDIDDNYPSLATKASKMLKLFYDNADTKRWLFVLCEALDKTGRNQLRMSVQEIMMMNI